MANDILLTSDDDGYDIPVLLGEQLTVTNSEQVAQSIKQRLLHFLDEWFLDKEAGTEWYEKVFQRPVDKNGIDIVLKKRILDTNGVTSLKSYSSTFNKGDRNFSVDFKYTDEFTTTDQTGSVTIGV
jgi:hypothetical protein